MNRVAEINLTAEENARSGRVLLAPMEGVVDFEMREMLTRVGSFDRSS